MDILRWRFLLHRRFLLCCGALLLGWLLPQSALAAGPAEGEGMIFLPAIANVAGAEDAAPVEAAAVIPTVTYYHYDATGNLMALSGQNGGVIWRAAMRPFGNGTPTSDDFPLGFDGRLQEAGLGSEGGLYHLGARLYDPISGRFLSADPHPQTELPLEDPQYLNLYAYGLNNPYRYGDRTGLVPGTNLTPEEVEKTGKVLSKILENRHLPIETRDAVLQAQKQYNHAITLLRSQGKLSPQQVSQAADKLLEIHGLVTEGMTQNHGVVQRLLSQWRRAKLFKGKGGVIGIVILIATVVPGVAEAASDDKYGTAILEAISPFWPQDQHDLSNFPMSVVGLAPPNFGPPLQFDSVREFNAWWSEGLNKWLATESE